MRKDFSQQLGQRIIIPGGHKTQYFDVADITYICCEDATVSIHTLDSSVSTSKQLKDLEDELADLGFIRINRSTIINQAHIRSYTGGEKKSIELTNGQYFAVSRRKAHLFK